MSAALGGAGVRVVLLEATGRLRTVSRRGRAISGGRLRSSRRRGALARHNPTVIRLREPSDWSLALLPMVPGGEAVGLVEVAAPDRSLRERMGDLERMVHCLGVGLRLSGQRSELERTVEGLDAALGGVDALLEARSADEAVRAAVGMTFARLRRPIVCVTIDPKRGLPPVLVMQGLESSRRAAVRRFVDGYLASPRFGRGERIRLTNGITAAAGLRAVHLAFVGRIAIVIARPDHLADQRFVERVAALLATTLERVEHMERATLRNEHLDQSIAWTAHELRAPLLATKLVLEQASTLASDPVEAGLLQQAQDELAGTAGLVGPLLRWASGQRTLRRRSVDLVRLVHDAVEASGIEARDRVRVSGRAELWVRAHPGHLRTAIVNVIRNAVAYGPAATRIDVSVMDVNDAGCVIVRDRGPGVAPRDREAIFDPFTRGAVRSRGTGGTGLGLFIARRILEAHGGTVLLLPSRRGAEFCIQLPVPAERSRASAS